MRILNLFETFDIKKTIKNNRKKKQNIQKQKKWVMKSYLSYLRGKMVKSFKIIL